MFRTAAAPQGKQITKAKERVRRGPLLREGRDRIPHWGLRRIQFPNEEIFGMGGKSIVLWSPFGGSAGTLGSLQPSAANPVLDLCEPP